MFSLHSVTKQVVRDSGNDDGESGKSVSEDDDEIFSLPDPKLNKTTTILLPRCEFVNVIIVEAHMTSCYI